MIGKLMAVGLVATSPINTTNVLMENEIVEIVQDNATITTNMSGNGDILLDTTSGNVGDIVNFTVKADFLYVIDSVSVNGNNLVANSDGSYSFVLVEGDNNINVVFKIDNEKIDALAKAIDNVKANGISSLFTLDNLTKIIYWLITAFVTSGFFITLIKMKKIKTQTIESISESFRKALEISNNETVANFLEKVLKISMTDINKNMADTNQAVQTMCRCLLLMQEDTPEARLAVVKELTALNTNQKDLEATVTAIIEQQQAEQKAKIDERDKAIAELKENNSKLITSDSNDGYESL